MNSRVLVLESLVMQLVTLSTAWGHVSSDARESACRQTQEFPGSVARGETPHPVAGVASLQQATPVGKTWSAGSPADGGLSGCDAAM